MDWTMVSNAEDAMQRIQAIFYLSRFRYEVDARTAGERLAVGSSGNPLCKQTIAELRAELTSPSTSLAMVRVSDAEVRVYLSALNGDTVKRRIV